MGAEVEILLGPAGSGKTSATYREMVDAAYREPGRQFYLIVPEQAGSSTEQRVLSVNRERTGRPGFFNVDILGFSRLAHKIFEMKGRDSGEVLGEYGKIILLRAVIAEVSSRLELYRGSVDRRGFVDEMKSLISEFLLFDILPEDLGGYFPEIDKNKQKCRFAKCVHIHEPDCGVKEALLNGEFAKERYDEYVRMYTALKEKRRY